jgi:phosphoglycerate kinase
MRVPLLSEWSPDRLRGRRVLVRVDYNVPLDDEGAITDPGRIDATLPTLAFLGEAGAKMILVSHLGRPDGTRDPEASLAPVARYLEERLGRTVPLLDDPPASESVRDTVAELAEGDILLLENIRYEAGETEDDPELGRALGRLGDLFVGEAFGAAHRAHASNVGAARAIRASGGWALAGFLMERELRFLDEALREPERPFVAVMGGAKISGKIDLIEAILPRVDRLLIGGAMANTFFRALGLETGASLVEPDRVELAGALLERAGERILLPVDVVVAEVLAPDAETRECDRTEVRDRERIADVGPTTRALFAEEIGKARTLLWNGPMGIFEMPPFAGGTVAVAHAIAEAADDGAMAIVGGGDSAAAAGVAGVEDRMTHISTGGGASLDLLAGRPLPGVEELGPPTRNTDEEGDGP